MSGWLSLWQQAGRAYLGELVVGAILSFLTSSRLCGFLGRWFGLWRLLFCVTVANC
jgi:hypothetical protein